MFVILEPSFLVSNFYQDLNCNKRYLQVGVSLMHV